MRSCDICGARIGASVSSYRVGLDAIRACREGDCLSVALKQQKERRTAEAQQDNEAKTQVQQQDKETKE